MTSKTDGLTLMELLLVTVMMSMIAMAVYTTFDNGIKLWKKVNEDVLQEDIMIFFVKISRDLRNSFRHSNIEFCGERDKIAFACPIKFRLGEEGEEGEEDKLVRGIGQVEYSFDSREDVINRVQSNYSQLYLDKTGPAHRLLGDVRSLDFRYYCYNPRLEQYLWVDGWDEQNTPLDVKTDELLPLAVRIEVEADDGGKKARFARIITIPAGRE